MTLFWLGHVRDIPSHGAGVWPESLGADGPLCPSSPALWICPCRLSCRVASGLLGSLTVALGSDGTSPKGNRVKADDVPHQTQH